MKFENRRELKSLKKINMIFKESLAWFYIYLLLGLASFMIFFFTRSVYALSSLMFFAWFTIMLHSETYYWKRVRRDEYIKQSHFQDYEKQLEEWRRRGRT